MTSEEALLVLIGYFSNTSSGCNFRYAKDYFSKVDEEDLSLFFNCDYFDLLIPGNPVDTPVHIRQIISDEILRRFIRGNHGNSES